MILGLYLIVRFLLWITGMMLLGFCLVLYAIGLAIAAVYHSLADSSMHRTKPTAPEPSPAKPRNSRLYYSDRR